LGKLAAKGGDNPFLILRESNKDVGVVRGRKVPRA